MRSKRNLAVLLGLWSVPALLNTLEFFSFATSRGLDVSFLFLYLSRSPRFYLWALVCSWLLGFCPSNSFSTRTNRFRLLGRHLLLVFPLTAGLTIIDSVAETWILRGAQTEAPIAGIALWTRMWLWRLPEVLILYSLLVGVAEALAYYLRSRERDVRALRLERELANARLAALKMQLNPHFLFNTLHAVSALVSQDTTLARRTLSLLGEILRELLQEREMQETSLARELELLNKYLEIEKIRFQERLNVEQEVAAETLDCQVPHLLLQPIVENSIHHGVEKETKGGRIWIRAQRRNDTLLITVRDDGTGNGNSPTREGIGLRNTRLRLEALYGRRARLEKEALDPGFLVSISLPFRLGGEPQ